MKCPKCSLVTFDHLSKCPRCRASFALARRLTHARRDPNRRIVLPPAPTDKPAAKPVSPPPQPIAPPPELPFELPPTPGVPAAAVPEPRTPAASVPCALEPDQESLSPEPSLPVVPLAVREPAPAGAQVPGGSTHAIEDRTAHGRAQSLATPATDWELAAQPHTELVFTDDRTGLAAQAADARRLKDRMIRASRARRTRRPDLQTEVVDPLLPDWYLPAAADEQAEPTASSVGTVPPGRPRSTPRGVK